MSGLEPKDNQEGGKKEQEAGDERVEKHNQTRSISRREAKLGGAKRKVGAGDGGNGRMWSGGVK